MALRSSDRQEKARKVELRAAALMVSGGVRAHAREDNIRAAFKGVAERAGHSALRRDAIEGEARGPDVVGVPCAARVAREEERLGGLRERHGYTCGARDPRCIRSCGRGGPGCRGPVGLLVTRH